MPIFLFALAIIGLVCLVIDDSSTQHRTHTNADRIRKMSDEKLAKENIYFVSELIAREGLHYTGLDGHYYRTAEEVVEANMKWLRSEVEE